MLLDIWYLKLWKMNLLDFVGGYAWNEETAAEL